MRFDRYLLLSLVSGAAWGLLASMISTVFLDTILWGGVISSPAIGLAIGLVNRPVLQSGFIRKALFATISLFISVALFVLATGIGKLIADGPGELSTLGSLASWIRSAVYGITVIPLWPVLVPLAILNQHVLSVMGRVNQRG